MKKVLLLLTEAFPFTTNAEAFLEPEIEISSSFFDEIYIFPTALGIDNTVQRQVPNRNIHISQVPRGRIFIEFIESTIFILKHKGFWQDARYFNKHGLLFNLSAWKKLIYTLITERAIIKHFKKSCFTFDKNTIYVIYSYWLFGEAGGAVTIKRLLNGRKVIAIARGHGSDIAGYPTLNGYSPLKKYQLDSLDMVYPISHFGKDTLEAQYEKYGFNKTSVSNKICPIHLGIENLCELEEPQLSNTGEFTILSCSSIKPVKRVHLIVEALSLIRKIKVKWIHIGGGELLDEIKENCRRSLGENIIVDFKGSLPRIEVVNVYKTTDVHLFLNVSSSEGIPVSMMEAFSFGIPAIATKVGGTSELCKDGINGYLLPSDFESTDLSQRIIELFHMVKNDFEKYEELRSAARETILRDFSLNNHKTLYESVLMKVHE